jgi:hypothetical protein
MAELQPEITNTKTAAEQAAVLRTAGQRRVNLTWEITQAIVAVVLTTGVLIVAGILIIRGDARASDALLLLSNAFFMIISQYFTRTNHTKVGGVQKEDEGR